MFWNRKGILLKKRGKTLENWMVDNHFIIMEIVGANFSEMNIFVQLLDQKGLIIHTI